MFDDVNAPTAWDQILDCDTTPVEYEFQKHLQLKQTTYIYL